MKKVFYLTSLLSFLIAGVAGAQETNQIPNFNTDAEKEQWIKANPKKYRELHRKNPPQGAAIEKEEVTMGNTSRPLQPVVVVKENTIIQYVNIPGFPTYERTENKEEDDKKYSIAKDKWIKENPELYKQMNSSPVDNSRKNN